MIYGFADTDLSFPSEAIMGDDSMSASQLRQRYGTLPCHSPHLNVVGGGRTHTRERNNRLASCSLSAVAVAQYDRGFPRQFDCGVEGPIVAYIHQAASFRALTEPCHITTCRAGRDCQ
jgi:hypothetical protein